ncbi:MAG: prephenate dehydrogenase/arogenate dehydrogenase family protein [Chloroflexota bacterium]|nr:prephenate dehydrogenase/arogenate dehydrogenase family protein [Chloroflexota bacterium]
MAPRITIVGTGLIGASLGLALKKAKLGYEIVGHDKSTTAANKAKKLGAVDKTEWNLINAVEGAGLVILALPVDAIKPTLEAIAPYLSEGAVVTDTASTKQLVLDWAKTILPPGVNFVGGHPLVRADAANADAASADLFTGATYCLIPGAGAQPDAVQLLVGLATTVGAEPFFPDATEHDNFQAAVAHLPLLLATALMDVATASPANREIRKMAGADFRRATALADTDAETSAQICAANRDGILRWMDAYTKELARLRVLVAAGGPQLQEVFDQAAASRAQWGTREEDERSVAMKAATDTASDQMKRFFLGDLGKKIGKGAAGKTAAK